MSRVSSPRGEHAPRPGAGWNTELTAVEVFVPDTNEPLPRQNRATRRAIARANRRSAK